jgi:hypothetical protein
MGPGERDDGGIGVGHRDIGNVTAPILLRHRRRNQADATSCSHQGENLLDTGRVGGHSSRQSVPSLLGQPAQRNALLEHRTVGDEAELARSP